MKIYESEKALGLESDLVESSVLHYTSQANLAKPLSSKVDEETKAILRDKITKATNQDQDDLYYLSSILVTTGWNKNDDIFLPVETWAARATPEDKPFDYEHDEKDIIGHITHNYAIDFDGNVLDDPDFNIHEPLDFHIVTEAVLYKYWQDETLATRMADIIEEIPKGEWFVSMEALFNDFDYGIMTSEGEHRIIKRDESTAFLTASLKRFGGEGTYKNYRVGRVLKDILFKGKGLVRQPANPSSIIFSSGSVETFAGTNLDVESIKIMVPENKEAVMPNLEKELQDAKATITSLESKLQERDEKALAEERETHKAEVEAKDAVIEELKAQLTKANESVEAQETKVAELETAKKEMDEKMKKMEDEKKKGERHASLVSIGYTDDQATEKMEKFASFSDDAFSAVLEELKTIKATVKTSDKQEETKASDTSEEDAEAAVDEALEDAEASDEGEKIPANASSEEIDELAEELAQYAEAQYKTTPKEVK